MVKNGNDFLVHEALKSPELIDQLSSFLRETLQAPTSQNGQTHSHNVSATANEYLVGSGQNWLCYFGSWDSDICCVPRINR